MNTKELKQSIDQIIAIHNTINSLESLRSPADAYECRVFEQEHSITYKDDKYHIEFSCKTTCTCASIYYEEYFIVDSKELDYPEIEWAYRSLNGNNEFK